MVPAHLLCYAILNLELLTFADLHAAGICDEDTAMCFCNGTYGRHLAPHRLPSRYLRKHTALQARSLSLEGIWQGFEGYAIYYHDRRLQIAMCLID